MLVELWQVAVFIVAICILILTIYVINTLQGINKTIEQLRTFININSENIHVLTKELVEISKNANSISEEFTKDMDKINGAIQSIQNTSEMVEETVQMGKDHVILPIMGLVNLGNGLKNVAQFVHKKDS
ncbi:DUF948 domain-containing protein [Garciella nitratireducens]|uniref:DUF948 domain-containing protein n=1 Tax=Garciella nitratireducens DSM 15102 TaxID=1121911 RepID=A0A1T4NGN2_9FIRM|nr:DUF948 domain-containing protein [Garciella nitratireducens]RBP42872.1 uncharacterized protein DUF948 [Garciella nitratireducens]SJZ78177.1 protein of unknown function [Garciella nitratireducens DSM 15102]